MHLYEEPSHTFGEYLLVPGYSSEECRPENVTLKTPLVKFRRRETPAAHLSGSISTRCTRSSFHPTSHGFPPYAPKSKDNSHARL